MKMTWANTFAAAAGLGIALNAGAALALPDHDRKSPGYDHFEDSVGTLVQSEACLATSAHTAAIGLPLYYSVTDFSRYYKEDFDAMSAQLLKKIAEIKDRQESPLPPQALLAELRARHETAISDMLGDKSASFWLEMEKQAAHPLPPSRPFMAAYKEVLTQKDAAHSETLIDKFNTLPMVMQMDDQWRIQRRNVLQYPDAYLMKQLVLAYAPALKKIIAGFYPDEAEAMVDEAFGKVLANPTLYTQGSSIFSSTLQSKYAVTDEKSLAAARNMDDEWAHMLRENTPMDQAELMNYSNELQSEISNAFIGQKVPQEKVQALLDVLWTTKAATLSPADMGVADVNDSPLLREAVREVILSIQTVVEQRTGISVKAGNVVHIPAKPGCPAP